MIEKSNDVIIRHGYKISQEYFAGAFKYIKYHKGEDRVDVIYSDDPKLNSVAPKRIYAICVFVGAVVILLSWFILFHTEIGVLILPDGYRQWCYYFSFLGLVLLIAGLAVRVNDDIKYKDYVKCPDSAEKKQCKCCFNYYYSGTVDKCPHCGK